MTSLLHHDVTVVITFYTLTFKMISTIFNVIFKDLYKTLFLGRKMHNTAQSFNEIVLIMLIPTCILFPMMICRW